MTVDINYTTNFNAKFQFLTQDLDIFLALNLKASKKTYIDYLLS